ncbi:MULTISPECIES: c-type cytochrome [unclassified Pseudomonas]|uniref:c-type cytochrome n=1 Tax=unclassified Pseudomonas TaxID=196821 RepID=UPI00244AC3F7|nr:MULTISPECIES: c-type cytochrome [unclassified Pseudomonas]MDG9925073.1 c-type cytochrome [Pseudomonas sp. GD04045]MDH0037052.1 c-type cytochrome [Pseudomonas sp. GD04019]
MQAGRNRGWRDWAMVLGLGALLAGCGGEDAPPAQANTGQGVPQDAVLAQLYGASCKQCHANPAAGAPLTGDAAAWAPRLEKGIDTLLDHSINGFQGMPPLGLCMQCSEPDFRALIEFMAAAPQPAEGR